MSDDPLRQWQRVSTSYNSSDTIRSAVNQQSGILAHSGSSGYINDLTLNGAYLLDEAGLAGNNSNLTLLGEFTSTDINNHASIDSTSISASFTTTPTPPKDPASTQKTEAASHLNLPSKQANATNSTTHSVVAGITFTDGNGAVVDTGNVRATLDGANQTLKDPAKQDLNALQVFMGTLAAVEATNQVGNLAMFKDHEDGSAAKVTLHAINGGLTHLLTGGKSTDIGGAMAGAAATEALMAYAKTGNNQTDQLMASLIGGTASALSGGNFDDGAVSGGFADAFNRQLHEKEIALIEQNAKAVAKMLYGSDSPGDVAKAKARLTQEVLRQIDHGWAVLLGDNKDTEVARILSAMGADSTFTDEYGREVGYFSATEAEYHNSARYLEYMLPNRRFYDSAGLQSATGVGLPAFDTAMQIALVDGDLRHENAKSVLSLLETMRTEQKIRNHYGIKYNLEPFVVAIAQSGRYGGTLSGTPFQPEEIDAINKLSTLVLGGAMLTRSPMLVSGESALLGSGIGAGANFVAQWGLAGDISQVDPNGVFWAGVAGGLIPGQSLLNMTATNMSAATLAEMTKDPDKANPGVAAVAAGVASPLSYYGGTYFAEWMENAAPSGGEVSTVLGDVMIRSSDDVLALIGRGVPPPISPISVPVVQNGKLIYPTINNQVGSQTGAQTLVNEVRQNVGGSMAFEGVNALGNTVIPPVLEWITTDSASK